MVTPMRPILRFVVRHPWLVIATAAVVTAGLLVALPRIDVNTDFESYIDHDDPAYVALQTAENQFGSSDILMIALVAEDTIYDADLLAIIEEMTQRLEDLAGIDEVRTPLNTRMIEATGDSIEVGPIAPGEAAPRSQEEIDAFRARVESNDAVLGVLVSKDATAANLLVTYETSADAQTLTRQVTDLVDEYRDRYTFYISGMHFLSQSLSESMSADLVKLLPIVILVIILVLYGSFRSFRGVWIPLLVVGLSIVWVFGLMSLFGASVTAVSFLLPVLLLAIGIAYGIHILSHIDEHARPEADRKDSILRAMEGIHTPVWMTGLTTVAGFMALATSFLPVLRSFGLAAAVGVAIAMILSILLIPALLAVLPPPRRRKVETHDGRIARGLRRAGRAVAGHRRLVLYVSAGLLCLFAAGMPFMPMDSSISAFLGERHPAVQGMDVMQAHFSGSEQVIIEIDTGLPDGLKDPAVLAQMVALETYLKTVGIRKTTSLTDVVRELNRKFHADDPAYDVIPEDRALIAQLLLLYSFQGGDLGGLANRNFSAGEIIGFYPRGSQDELRTLVTSTRAYLKTKMGAGIEASMVGSTALQYRMTSQLLTSQLVSLGTSVVTAAAIVAILMGSVVAGLVAILPLLFAIVISFGTMGFAGMTLNIATAMISSITIGIGIDYAIHFISRYRKEYQSRAEVADAVAQTAATAGRAILFNAASVIGGFLVLLVSTFSAFKSFGGLVSLSMATSAISALVVIPAIFAMWSPRFLARQRRRRGGTRTNGWTDVSR
jgi:predicted RND superfamily exporter protein